LTDTYRIAPDTSLRAALAHLERTGRGLAVITDSNDVVTRTITDGDLRRLILAGYSLENPISLVPERKPITIPEDTSRVQALEMMNTHELDHLPLVDSEGRLVDVYDRTTLSKHIYLSSPHMGDYEKKYVDEAFQSNWIAPVGPNVDAFEAELSDMLGIKSAAAVSSGSAALHLSLRILDVGKGDIVFCSSLTFIASASPIVYQGAEPVFIDSEPDSWNMSPKALERALSVAKSVNRMPKAIILVNLYGQSADMDPLMELADAFGVPIVEDAAESLGAKYKGRPSGTFGKMGVFSFNGNKIITTSGGGMLVSDDEEIIKRARFLSTQAREPALHYEHMEIGYNYRMSNILAGVGRGQLQVLNDRVASRRKLFEGYESALKDVDGLTWMPEPTWSFSNRWLSVATLDPMLVSIDSLSIMHKLSDEMIEARPVWKPLHRQPVFEGCTYYSHDNNSVSDDLYKHGICLPSGSNMTQNDIDRVTEILIKCIGGKT
jgi:dTDP-4-amino-4,6-dideoxygalactose transaminase